MLKLPPTLPLKKKKKKNTLGIKQKKNLEFSF